MLTIIVLSLSIVVVSAGKPLHKKFEKALFIFSMNGQNSDLILTTPESLEKEFYIAGYDNTALYRTLWQPNNIGKGTFTMTNIPTPPEKYSELYYDDEDVDVAGVYHYRRYENGVCTKDYWTVYLVWTKNFDYEEDLETITLTAETNRNSDEEGTYNSEDETWAISDTWNTELKVLKCSERARVKPGKGSKSYECTYLAEELFALNFIVTIDKEPLE